MKISVSPIDFHKVVDGVEGDIAEASTGAMRDTTPQAQEEFRAQTREAGLGNGVANAWRDEVYPTSAKSVTPTGYIWSNAPEIIEAFAKGAAIVPVNGSKYLAIPTKNVPRALGRRRKKMTPLEVEIAFNQDLLVRPGKHGHLLAFVNVVRSRNDRAWRQGTKRRVAQGRAVRLVLMFTLVSTVQLARLLDLDAVAARWGDAYIAALKSRLGVS
ncbi:MAG: DUF6441 family protein [Sphingomonas sp.]